jgi:8-oxo-dGTP pyrophosphatase MutT (NUDIX family)
LIIVCKPLEGLHRYPRFLETRPAVTNSGVPREISSGGVVVRRMRGRWWLAAIRPGGKSAGVWALPKGLVGRGEDPAATAVREVAEETGLEAVLETKLGDVRYVYTRRGARIFKIVSFYFLRYRRGRIGAVSPEHAHEIEDARWLPLEEAPRLLAYRGERDMADRALAYVRDQVV